MNAVPSNRITNQKIMVVDDNPASLYSTSRILRSGGFEVIEAMTGTDALAAAEHEVALIVLDINLPDIDGLEVCRRLRARSHTAFLPIVHLTATFVAVSRAAKIPARMVWAMDYGYAEFYLTDANGKGTWYPCVVHQDVELGACKDVRPILEKGDNFKIPEEKALQRFVEEFLKGKDTGGGRPAVEFRRHNLD